MRRRLPSCAANINEMESRAESVFVYLIDILKDKFVIYLIYLSLYGGEGVDGWVVKGKRNYMQILIKAAG